MERLQESLVHLWTEVRMVFAWALSWAAIQLERLCYTFWLPEKMSEGTYRFDTNLEYTCAHTFQRFERNRRSRHDIGLCECSTQRRLFPLKGE